MPIATNSGRIDISTERLTKDIAEKISAQLKKNQIIFLYGEIGVGKTTFVRYLINKLQKDNDSVYYKQLLEYVRSMF